MQHVGREKPTPLFVMRSAAVDIVKMLRVHSEVSCVCLLPSGDVATVATSGIVKIWDARTRECISSACLGLRLHYQVSVYDNVICTFNKGWNLATTGVLNVFDVATGEVIWESSMQSLLNARMVSSDTLIMHTSGDIKLWQVQTMSCTRTWTGAFNWMYVMFTGVFVTCSVEDKCTRVQFWKTCDGACIHTLSNPPCALCPFAGTSCLLASESRGDDGCVRVVVWSARTGAIIQTLPVPRDDRVRCGCMLSHHVLAVAYRCVIRLWNVRDGTCMHTLVGHVRNVNSMCMVTPSTLASASDDWTAILWDVRNIHRMTSDPGSGFTSYKSGTRYITFDESALLIVRENVEHNWNRKRYKRGDAGTCTLSPNGRLDVPARAMCVIASFVQYPSILRTANLRILNILA